MAQTVILAVVLVLVFNWLFIGKVTAAFADFDYRYWPPSWPRIITLVLAAITAAGSAIIFTPGKMPLWPLLVWAFVFGIWMFVAVDDVARQRQRGYRTPPRYSDPDE